MKLAVVRESENGESRVAATPETVKKLAALGVETTLEAGAGLCALFPDQAYRDAGASIAKDKAEALAGAQIVFTVRRPASADIARIPKGALLIGMLDPHGDPAAFEAYAAAGIDAFSLELMPRITRAQGMDVLSSQANLAGYRAVIEAVAHLPRAVPQMMTAAGTVAPARIFVIGAGVAGLQAIATAKRLGARVAATDVRLAAKEQVQSLGATFVMVEDEESKAAETAGGYAKEMSEAYRKKQAALVAETVVKQDVVITTALVPGRPVPKLISEEMVRAMRPGAVIVDLAATQGGNCALTVPDEVRAIHGVTIIGTLNLAGLIPVDASALYARNLLSFLTPLIDRERQALKIEPMDEIVRATAMTRGGKLIHPLLTSLHL